jgi:cell division protein FtsI (penicillin-binding protein 3)
MASYPTFNPNDLKKVKPDARRNRAVVDAFEPGSTMKAMLLAAALDANVVRINDVIDCENGVFKVGRHRIRDTHKAGLLTVAEVVAQSSNIGSLKIGTMMGRQRWGAALSAYGFGRRTGLGLGGESPGLMWPAERWSDATLATTSFGQGISVTGVQMTSALAALANGGVLMQPRVVERIRSADGRTVEELGPVVVRRVVGAKAAQSTLRALEAVVGPTGTAPLATVPGVLVAGKTGTAQKVDPGARGYGDKRVASFVGVAPSRDPRLVIMVMVDEPADSPYGGVVAAPAFREIAMAALPLMGVSVESTPPVAPAVAAGKVEGADILAATRKLRERLAADDPADGIEPDVVDGTPGVARVPDLTGKSPRAAVREALAAGLEPALEGSGVVVSQRPEAGSPMPTPRAVKLRLGPQGEQGG